LLLIRHSSFYSYTQWTNDTVCVAVVDNSITVFAQVVRCLIRRGYHHILVNPQLFRLLVIVVVRMEESRGINLCPPFSSVGLSNWLTRWGKHTIEKIKKTNITSEYFQNYIEYRRERGKIDTRNTHIHDRDT
jgi:hypothetical protein